MVYIRRHAEKSIKKLNKMFGAVLVTGARQVGKSTLLEHIAVDFPMLSFDDTAIMEAAHSEPALFFEYNKPPLFLDEIQKAPHLFPEIKKVIDRSKKKGIFYLSGSQQFEMMQNVSESLSGRVGIIDLMGISLREENGDNFVAPFVPNKKYLNERVQCLPNCSAVEVWRRIQRGSMPALIANKEIDCSMYYGAYVRTYIERDVRQIIQIENLMKFQIFMGACAARTGGMINAADIAKDVGISQPTVQSWLSVLLATGIIYLLKPYYSNATNRVIKTPKLYFKDTGLAAYLTKWSSPEVLRNGAMSGAFFETFVISEILKSYYNAGELDPPLYFYRDKDKNEIDLLVIQNGTAHPIEIKKTAAPNKGDIAAFRVLNRISGLKRGTGGVVCLSERLLPLTDMDSIIPLTYV